MNVWIVWGTDTVEASWVVDIFSTWGLAQKRLEKIRSWIDTVEPSHVGAKFPLRSA